MIGMSPVEIRVRGSHQMRLPPDQATMHATISRDGPEPEPVFQSVSGTLAHIAASIEARHHPHGGPVTSYAVDQIRMGSHRPWNNEGHQLPLVHNAAVTVRATFTDFDDLARWVSWAAALEGLSIGYVDWDLTVDHRQRAEREARQEAVRDARRRAQDYADALDLGTVRVTSVNDPGLGGGVQHKVMMASAVAAGGTPEFALRPEDVEITADVEACFTVPDGG